MKADRCVPVVVQLHYFIYGVERYRVKNIHQCWVWPCEAIGRKTNYFLSLTFGPMRHIYVMSSRLLFNPLTQTKNQILGGADKSLARPERKQATATKLEIYSTHCPRSSIHFLALPLTFASHSKKKIQMVVRLARSPLQQWPPSRTKNGDRSIVVLVQGTGGSPTGPDPESRVGNQDTGCPGRPVSSGLQVPGEPGHCHTWTRPPWWPSRGRCFSFKMSFSCTSRDE